MGHKETLVFLKFIDIYIKRRYMAETISKTSSDSKVINRDSLSMNLEDRYKKSTIKETKAPVAVDFFNNAFAKGFTIKEKTTDQTGAQSIYQQGLSSEKYSG